MKNETREYLILFGSIEIKGQASYKKILEGSAVSRRTLQVCTLVSVQQIVSTLVQINSSHNLLLLLHRLNMGV